MLTSPVCVVGSCKEQKVTCRRICRRQQLS